MAHGGGIFRPWLCRTQPKVQTFVNGVQMQVVSLVGKRQKTVFPREFRWMFHGFFGKDSIGIRSKNASSNLSSIISLCFSRDPSLISYVSNFI